MAAMMMVGDGGLVVIYVVKGSGGVVVFQIHSLMANVEHIIK